MLSITPHLVRHNLRTGLAVTEFDSGAQTSMLSLKAIGPTSATTLRIVTIAPLSQTGASIAASVPPPFTINVLP